MNGQIILKILYFLLFFSVTAFAQSTLKLATTTSTYETGLLDYIFPAFEKKYDVKIHIISVGTGKAIKLGENGDVDVILVHDRKVEDKFVKDGFGVNRRDVMYNDFFIAGPKNDPAKIAGIKDAKEALMKIYKSKNIFVSRGDDSGTDKKEKYLWSKTGIKPEAERYLEVGQGMIAALKIADEKNAYVITDRASFITMQDKIGLILLCDGDKDLFNPYGIIAVSPYKYPTVKYDLSMALVAWIISPECQNLINSYKKNGQQLYYADEANPIE